jgi:hypothetical protein
MRKKRLLICFLLAGLYVSAQSVITTDVLIIGGGTSGVAAGIQSARLGANTIITEPTPWLGGMISAAGVSATDGNNKMPSGIWSEFRSKIYEIYGGPKAVETGWVSNTLFEPHVADSIFKTMASAESHLKVFHHYQFQSVKKAGSKIIVAHFLNTKTNKSVFIHAKIFVDATELGDVIKAAGISYDLGMEANSVTNDNVGVEKSNNIVQDLTYVATLKDFGADADKTIPKPVHYSPAEFDGACTDYYIDKSRKAPGVDAKKMLDYGKLPNNKYMLNWPGYGNDTYLNVVELNEEQRSKELEKAKQTTLRFVYFIQHQLGFKNLGLADDEFPTADKLALIPYYREARRVRGVVRLTMRHISEPFTYGDPLYRTGIAVGDYPIDHHHKKNPEAPQHLEFYPIPSFNVPLGALIPKQNSNLIAAEKAISVSNVVNGTTRLQPCVLLIGQAAGALAALSSLKKVQPIRVQIRTVQKTLLDAKAYLMPYIDVTPDDLQFSSIQKIGATGILKGKGIPYKWANQTWFYPDSLVGTQALLQDLNEYKKGDYKAAKEYLNVVEAIMIAKQLNPKWATNKSLEEACRFVVSQWDAWGLKNFEKQRFITRREFAVLMDNTAKPFELLSPDHRGYYQIKNKNN